MSLLLRYRRHLAVVTMRNVAWQALQFGVPELAREIDAFTDRMIADPGHLHQLLATARWHNSMKDQIRNRVEANQWR